MENKEKLIEPPAFIFPSLEHEMGEIERAAELFAKENSVDFIERFMVAARGSELVELAEEVWRKLENSDSFEIAPGDWGTVERHASQMGRDWQSLKSKIELGRAIDAPIILKTENRFYLISGNTRLMVSRALSKMPDVLIVEMQDMQK